MYFQSYVFLLLFLPVTLIGYHVLEKLFQKDMGKVYLLLMSFVFYGTFHIAYLVILLSSILFNYSIYKGIYYVNKEANKRILFLFGLMVNISALVYFKYSNFFIENINHLFGQSYELLHILLPMGISFYTFMQIAFLSDVVKKKGVYQYGILDYMLYCSFFPYITSGPIALHSEIIPQFIKKETYKPDWDMMAEGIQLFTYGLGKKILLADVFGSAVSVGFSDVWKLNSLSAFVVMISYTFQIYFDFSGYTDMALGIGKMFHIMLPQNFNQPYRSKTIVEFWERWHMTLTRFFTKYVYIPLGGNRRGSIITYRNTAIIFLLSGLWHGANWTFVLWGCLHGCFFILTKIWIKKINRIPSILLWLTTFGFLNVTWSIFRADSIPQMLSFFNRFRDFSSMEVYNKIASSFGGDWQMIAYLLIALVFCLKVPEMTKLAEKKKTGLLPSLSVILILFLSVLSFAKVTTFVYFNF
jgi:alginate O-acetyltransferase complex protein AlgI